MDLAGGMWVYEESQEHRQILGQLHLKTTLIIYIKMLVFWRDFTYRNGAYYIVLKIIVSLQRHRHIVRGRRILSKKSVEQSATVWTTWSIHCGIYFRELIEPGSNQSIGIKSCNRIVDLGGC